MFSTEQLQSYLDVAVTLVISYGPRLILAIVVLLIGLWVIKRLLRLAGAALDKQIDDPTLCKFLTSLLSFILKLVLFISVASMVGIETTSMIAVLGAAGLAIGLALQGSLANFAGGALILFFKPYKVGDFIEAEGVSGTVAGIQIFNTLLKTPDNKVVIVPNAQLSNGIITNYSREAIRRVDLVFGIGYEDDISRARGIIEGLIGADERALTDPEPLVVVTELADSSVNLCARIWVNTGDYWPLYWHLLEKVKTSFDREGISIPYPQRDLHLIRDGG